MTQRLRRKLAEKKARDEARVEHLSTGTLERLVEHERGLWRAAARLLTKRREDRRSPEPTTK